MMKCTILGCGDSLGVPQLLCSCIVCYSNNIKNKRLRSSVYIESNNAKILVDTSPDFRLQAMVHNITQIDALLITHEHSDHISGINDIKPIALTKNNKAINTYLSKPTYKNLCGTFGYLFNTNSKIYKPILNPIIFEDYSVFNVNDIKVESFVQNHGEINSLGFRFGNLAYSTDFNHLPEKSLNTLKGVEIWVVDCLRYSWSPSHLNLEQLLNYIDIIKPKSIIVTHMSHNIDYEEFKKICPKGIEPAYDGMIINF